VRVTFQVDADGLLNVSARELTSGVEASVAVKPSYGLSDEEIARMLQDSFSTAEEDMKTRALREARVEADRLLLATRTALERDGDLLTLEERHKIDRLMEELGALAGQDDHRAIEAATERLAKGTEAFAAERMNRSIRQALAGRRVEEV